MKYMLLTFASQRDYDGMAGRPGDEPVWSQADFAALGEFMSAFNRRLEESGELVETRGLAAQVHTRRLRTQRQVIELLALASSAGDHAVLSRKAADSLPTAAPRRRHAVLGR